MSILKGQIWTDGYLPSADNGSFLPISLNTDGSVRTDFGQTLVDGYVAVDFGEIKSSDSYACYATLAAGDKDIVALFGTHSRLIYFGSYGTLYAQSAAGTDGYIYGIVAGLSLPLEINKIYKNGSTVTNITVFK